MRHFRFTPLLFVTCTTVGCSSFNNSFNNYSPNHVPVATQTIPAQTTSAVKSEVEPVEVEPGKEPGLQEDEDLKCPPFNYVLSGKGPELPTEEIIAAGSDIVAIEKIERRHIIELRNHMAKMQRRLKKAMLEHQMQCKSALD